MNILIIGGGGYLGVPLSKELTKKGHNVVVFDNFKYNTQDLIDCKIIIGDVGAITLRSDFHYPSFDTIFYLSQSRLNELENQQQVDVEVNSFKKFIDSFNWSGMYFTPKVYFVSSCSVYGKTNEIVDENSPTIVTSHYSKMKIECEKYLIDKKNNNFKIVRLSTLYGNSNPIRKDVFINNILEDIKYDKEIEIFDPTAKRPHLHVLDCVKILSKLISSNFDSEILNIGFNELNVSKIELINIMKTYINFNHITHQTEDSRNYHVNFDLLQKYIDHSPITYSNGIKDYLKLE